MDKDEYSIYTAMHNIKMGLVDKQDDAFCEMVYGDMNKFPEKYNITELKVVGRDRIKEILTLGLNAEKQLAELKAELDKYKNKCRECKRLTHKIELNIKDKLTTENEKLKAENRQLKEYIENVTDIERISGEFAKAENEKLKTKTDDLEQQLKDKTEEIERLENRICELTGNVPLSCLSYKEQLEVAQGAIEKLNRNCNTENCERLKEKNEEIKKLKEDKETLINAISKYNCGEVKIVTDSGILIETDEQRYNILVYLISELGKERFENSKLKNQFKTNTKQVCEKIREKADKYYKSNMLGCDYDDEVIAYRIDKELLDQIEKDDDQA